MEIRTQSGNKLVINPAPYADAMELKSCIMEVLSTSDTDFDLSFLTNKENDFDLAQFIKIGMKLDASRPVQRAVLDCLIRCTYNGQKIDTSVFENDQAREDYYEIVFHCLKANIGPFLKGLLLPLKTFFPKKGNVPTS